MIALGVTSMVGLIIASLWIGGELGDLGARDADMAEVAYELTADGDWEIDSLAWVGGERVLVARAVRGAKHLSTMIYIGELQGESVDWTALDDLTSLGCRDPALIAPIATGPRSFAYIEGCLGADESPATSKHILDYSFGQDRPKPLYPYGLPFPAGGFTLDPGSGDGLLNDGTGLQEKLRWLRPAKLSPPIRLSLERVGNPAWAPTRSAIALAGVVGLGRLGGAGRSLASRWTVYLADTTIADLEEVPVAEFDEEPPWLSWSHDGSLLAISGRTGGAEGHLYLFRPADGRTVEVASGLYGAVAWLSPSRLAVVRHREYDGLGGDVIDVLDISAALDALSE